MTAHGWSRDGAVPPVTADGTGSARRGHVRALVAVAAVNLVVAVSGCLPLPFASPPIAASTGLALPAGTVLKPRRAGPTPVAPELIFVLHAGASPFQLVPELEGRSYDAGLGFLFELVEPTEGLTFYHYGGYVEGAWIFLNEPPWRLSLGGMAELLLSDLAGTDEVAPGIGATAQLSAELVTFASEPVSTSSGDGAFVGWVHGELGVGLYLAFSVRYFVDDTYVYGVAGLRVRLPASFGIAIVPLIR